MFKKNDPYTFSNFCTLLHKTDTPIGCFFSEYQVSAYDDVQLQNVNSIGKKNRKFLIHCTQKINIYNPTGVVLKPPIDTASYEYYPVLINTIMALASSDISGKGLSFELLEYSPQTVNTKTEHSGGNTNEKGEVLGTTSSNTIGSTTSETNSYGASVTISAAEFGESVSANYEHSSTTSYEHSQTVGSEASSSRSMGSSSSSSMSMKDWGAYSLINAETKSPSWTFGQEYPWNAIGCRTSSGQVTQDQVKLVIPADTQVRLWDGQRLYPPSHLSMFGVNFIMKALWLVTLDETASDSVEFTHTINYFSGSHNYDGKTVNVFMDQLPSRLSVADNDTGSLNVSIDLGLMGLDPITHDKHGIVGFISNKFITVPNPAGDNQSYVPFKIASLSNNVIVNDTTNPVPIDPKAGFSSLDTVMQATFTQKCTKLQMTAYFKVTDTIHNYSLYMKHWIVGKTGIKLTIVVNGNNTITKFINDLESEGGENNLTTISMRNQDFASSDYHDYLELGLNSVQITIEPIDAFDDCVYQVRALSIEKV